MDEFRQSLRPTLLTGDERLARLVARGNVKAFATLYERYHQSLYRYCRSILIDDADVDDVVQSSFTRALQALQRGRRDAPLRPWLFRIVHNEAVSVLRRRSAEERLSANLGRRPAWTADQAGEREQLGSLFADLRELPDRQRGALLMRELNGLSHKEIALALGTSVSGARQAIFEARTALSEFVEGRAMACEEVRRMLSDGDRRVVRRRRVRAHLHDCAECAAFAAAVAQRRVDVNALSPPLPAVPAAAMLARVLRLVSHGAAGNAGRATGLASGAMSRLAEVPLASKLLAAAVVTAGVAAGTSGTLVVWPNPGGPATQQGQRVADAGQRSSTTGLALHATASKAPDGFAHLPDGGLSAPLAAGPSSAWSKGLLALHPTDDPQSSAGEAGASTGSSNSHHSAKPESGGKPSSASSAPSDHAPRHAGGGVPGQGRPRGPGTQGRGGPAPPHGTGGSHPAGGERVGPGASPGLGHGAGAPPGNRLGWTNSELVRHLGRSRRAL